MKEKIGAIANARLYIGQAVGNSQEPSQIGYGNVLGRGCFASALIEMIVPSEAGEYVAMIADASVMSRRLMMDFCFLPSKNQRCIQTPIEVQFSCASGIKRATVSSHQSSQANRIVLLIAGTNADTGEWTVETACIILPSARNRCI